AGSSDDRPRTARHPDDGVDVLRRSRRHPGARLPGAHPRCVAAVITDLTVALDWLGGSVTEHSEGGWVINLSPRLRTRLGRPTDRPFPPTTRLTDREVIDGTPLTEA